MLSQMADDSAQPDTGRRNVF